MQEIFREIKTKIQLESRPNLNFSAHIHEDLELVYVKKGAGFAFCDGKKYELHPGVFFLAFPNQVHRYAECETGEYLVLIIKPAQLLSYGEVFLDGAPVSAVTEGEKKTVDLLELALEEYRQEGYSPVISAYLTALFGRLLRQYPLEKEPVSRDTVLEILQYCNRHYREELSVSDLAEALSISRSSVSHIFSQRIGMNFCDYVNSLRLTDALSLLRNKNFSVTEVAERCGFGTIRTFNRAFLKQYGVPPTQYRRRMN